MVGHGGCFLKGQKSFSELFEHDYLSHVFVHFFDPILLL